MNAGEIIHGHSIVSQFINKGTFGITAGTGVNYINADVTSTGTIAVSSGTVQFDGSTNVLGGTINGAGALLLTSGTDTISSGAAISIASLTINNGCSVTLDGSLTYANAFSLGNNGNSVVNLNGNNFTLSGTAFISQTIDGSGTFVTNGSTTLFSFTLGGTAKWQNNGTLTQTGSFTIGDGSSQAAEIVNEANGVYDMVDNSGIYIGSSPSSQFINDGTLEITDGTGQSFINTSLTSTGTIDVASGTAQFNGTGDSFSGTIDLAGATSTAQFNGGGDSFSGTIDLASATSTGQVNGTGNSFRGTIEGTGTFLISGGTDTFSSGAAISVKYLTINNGSTITLNETLTLTSANTVTINGASIVGSAGTLVTDGTTDLESVSFGGTVGWDNYGRVFQSTSFNLGQSGTSTTTIVNESGGVYELTADVSIGGGTDNAGLFDNAGTLEKTVGTGTSTISIAIENSGTLYAASGTLDLTGAVTGTGHLKVGGVNDVLELGGAVASTQNVLFVGSGGELELSDAPAFAATISSFAAGDSIDITTFGYSSSENLTFHENSGNTEGTLVIHDGTQSFSVELYGQYVAAGFNLAADGSGTAITYVPPSSPSTTPHLAAART